MRIFLRILFWILSIVLVVIVQTSFLGSFGYSLFVINIPLVISVLCIFFRKLPEGIVFGLCSAYGIELLSSFPFGVGILAMIVALGTVVFLQKNVVKNIAIHAALIHICSATVAFHAVMISAVFLLQKLHIVALGDFQFMLYLQFAFGQLVVHAILAVLAAVCIQRFSTIQ